MIVYFCPFYRKDNTCCKKTISLRKLRIINTTCLPSLVIAHQTASVTVIVARVPLIPASKKVVLTCPLSVDDEEADCTRWLGRISMVLELMVLELWFL